jgi:hypothetical protein
MFLETPWLQVVDDKYLQRDLSICRGVQGKVILANGAVPKSHPWGLTNEMAAS